ncbi:MAG: succinyl-diaminopimelate desuccinylase [Magnetovibrionaceae bacterium]
MANLDPVSLSQDLIRCASVTPADAGALDVLQTALEGLGFTVQRLPFDDVDNLYARLGTASPNFCFAGHTDVVPPGDSQAWEIDPFAGEVRDGLLWGRGASDMKSAIACFVTATERFLATKADGFAGSISLLITGDEEGDAVNGTTKVLDWLAEQGEVLDHCLVGEPTNPDALGDMIKIGRRGSMNGFLTVTGTQGHAAYPHLADNPIPRLARMLVSLTEEPLDEGSEHFQASTLAITTVDVGNPVTNVIPREARATFNVRFNDLHTSADVDAWVRKRLDLAGGDYDLRFRVSGESFLTPPGRLSDVVRAAVAEVTGREPELSTTGGTSDARFIKNYCPVVEFGIVGKTMHKVDERVAVEDVTRLTTIYEGVLERYFS